MLYNRFLVRLRAAKLYGLVRVPLFISVCATHGNATARQRSESITKKPRAKATIFSTIYDTRLKRALQRFF
jgi:hypothetical protein